MFFLCFTKWEIKFLVKCARIIAIIERIWPTRIRDKRQQYFIREQFNDRWVRFQRIADAECSCRYGSSVHDYDCIMIDCTCPNTLLARVTLCLRPLPSWSAAFLIWGRFPRPSYLSLFLLLYFSLFYSRYAPYCVGHYWNFAQLPVYWVRYSVKTQGVLSVLEATNHWLLYIVPEKEDLALYDCSSC